jgi:hypothetical protein
VVAAVVVTVSARGGAIVAVAAAAELVGLCPSLGLASTSESEVPTTAGTGSAVAADARLSSMHTAAVLSATSLAVLSDLPRPPPADPPPPLLALALLEGLLRLPVRWCSDGLLPHNCCSF